MKGGLVVERATGPAAEAGIQPATSCWPPTVPAEQRRGVAQRGGEIQGHIALLIQRGETRLFVPVRVG